MIKSITIGETYLMDDPLSWLYIAIIVALIFVSAFCSSTETAFACLNKFKVRVQADEGNKKAKLILKTYDRFDRTLIMSLLGYNISSVAISTLSAILFFSLLDKYIDETLISLISTAAMTILVYIFSDMVPKMIARAMPERVAANNVYIAKALYYLLFPLIYLFSGLTFIVNKMFKGKQDIALTEEDFTNVVDDLEKKDLIEDNESDIIYASLDFTDTSVRDVLTKRNKIFYIDVKGLSKDKLNDAILSTQFTRIPVCYGSIDKMIGILHVKTYIKKYLENPNFPVLSSLQKPYYVSTRIKLDDMIEGFKKHHTHIAVVKNDDKVIGIITMEDVLEELVGKIAEPLKEKKR